MNTRYTPAEIRRGRLSLSSIVYSQLLAENVLEPAILVSVDGNESLKRMLNVGNKDERKFVSRYKIPHEDLLDLRPVERQPQSNCAPRWRAAAQNDHASSHVPMRYKNYDATGWCTLICRHGIVHKYTDMIRSGERQEYMHALVKHAVQELSPSLMLGYDIGCQYSTTLAHSAIKDLSTGVVCVCGVFHAHAHNRRCQLDYNPRYVAGAGLEDFEGNERLYSITNRLAHFTRSMSAYSRHQRIELQLDFLNHQTLFSMGNTIHTIRPLNTIRD